MSPPVGDLTRAAQFLLRWKMVSKAYIWFLKRDDVLHGHLGDNYYHPYVWECRASNLTLA
jgi:hypothetical protein